VVGLSPDGRGLPLYNDAQKAAAEIAKFSEKDSRNYIEFGRALKKIASVIDDVLGMPPPDIDNPSKGDLWGMLQTGRAVRKLGKKDMYRLLRWGPMAVADLVAEFFETELLRATVAARGIFGTAMGPWSAGSSLMLLIRAAADSHPAGSSTFAAGGAGAVTQAMASAAQKAGAEIRSGADVIEVQIKDGKAVGVVLSNGEEIRAGAIVSNTDPKHTLLKLIDPTHLAPGFVQKLKNYRMTGTVAKVNLALSGLPNFKAMPGANGLLSGRIHIGPEIDYLERAFDESKYGNFSRQPYLEVAIPSLSDPSLAPAGKHVMSVYMQYAPYKLKSGDWDGERIALGDTVVKTLSQYAPNLPGMVVHHQIITPQDLENTYGLTGGHIFHGELALDQFFTMRPLLDWARYNTPIANLFLCGSGTHPGAGLTGGSGANAAREILKHLKK
jgi:phytoene dehydrogenase-like protein